MSLATKFSYNNSPEYAFDMRDADDAGKYEAAIEKMAAEEKNLPKTGKSSEIIRAYCQVIKNFFDRVLAPGAGDAICTERSNTGVCNEAYMAFLDYCRAQKDEIFSAGNAFRQFGNQAQHRANIQPMRPPQSKPHNNKTGKKGKHQG